MAQSTMPWNPDANDDSFVGASDMLSTLAVYGQQIGIDSSLTCDYDGTEFEMWTAGVWDGDIILDSVTVQYHTIDSALVYLAGCPDPVWEAISYERSWTTNSFSKSGDYMYWTSNFTGYNRRFALYFSEGFGFFYFFIEDNEVEQLQLEVILGGSPSYALSSADNAPDWTIPFDTNLVAFNESGIDFSNWSGFLSGATYVDVLPYWHYAE